MQTKTCTKCGKTFPATQDYFYKRSDNLDGWRSYCKVCCGRQSYGINKRNSVWDYTCEMVKRIAISVPNALPEGAMIDEVSKRLKTYCKFYGADITELQRDVYQGSPWYSAELDGIEQIEDRAIFCYTLLKHTRRVNDPTTDKP